jgi:two-component system LytT family response regulator
MLLTEYCPQIEVVGEAANVPEGVKIIQRLKPDVVFLDIEMPGYTGFQLLDFFEKIDFEIIFATAYSEFALKAFQVSAIDYLLKPIQISQLIAAIDKVLKFRGPTLINERVETLRANMAEGRIKRIVLPLSEGSVFIDMKDVLFLKSEGSYVRFFLADGNSFLISKTIKDYENQLTKEEGFFRSHRSFLVNASHITRIDTDGATTKGNHLVMIARDRRTEFDDFMRQR